MPIEQDARKKPASVKVHVSTGQGVDIVWADGHASHYDFPFLRDHCPCALCNDEREKKTKLGGSALPMFKPRVTAKSASAVGNYAIQIEFTDSHATGIFSFVHLREVCPCAECAKIYRSEARAQEGAT